MKILSAFLLLLFSIGAFANPTEIHAIKASISNEVNTVLKKYDEEAYAVVNVVPKTAESALPGTPFSLKDIVLRNSNGQIRISKIEITVMTHAKELPESVNQVIAGLLEPYSVTPEIKIVPPPTALFNLKKFLFNLISPKNIVSVFGMGLFALLFLVFIRSRKSSSKQLSAAIESGVSRLSQSIEQAATKAEASAAMAEEETQTVTATDEDEAAQARNEKVISGLHNDSIVALFADCYWSHKDNYAAYLWGKSTVEQRAHVVMATPYLKKYCDLIADMPPVNLNFHQEPYYLKPLKIDHINNDIIVKELQKNNALAPALPRIRFENLTMTTRERIEYSQVEGDKNKNWDEHFGKIKASELRALRRRAKLQIRTDEEETDVLFMENITLDMKEDIVTIAWIKDLTVEEVDDILRPFTAQELASVWIGPAEVLDYMKSAIPEKKYNLMASYLEKVEPARGSAMYKSLHKTIIQRLKQREAFMEAAAEEPLDEAS